MNIPHTEEYDHCPHCGRMQPCFYCCHTCGRDLEEILAFCGSVKCLDCRDGLTVEEAA